MHNGFGPQRGVNFGLRRKCNWTSPHALQAAMEYRRKNHLNVFHRVASGGWPRVIPKRDKRNRGAAPQFVPAKIIRAHTFHAHRR
jgi:hypothetical protein